jgi:osmotically-inducible protein OsmY
MAILTEMRTGTIHSDETLAIVARAALEFHILVPAKDLCVVVRDGWVTLEGDVRWQFQRSAAEKAARHVPGVKGITNEIRITPKVAPTELKKQIKVAFRRAAEVEAHNIHIEASEGKVVLTGMVHSWVERDEATRQAWSTPGVKRVENRIVVHG